MSEKEIEQYIIAYGDDIYRFCLHLTGNEFLAEELYQDTFVQMVRSFHKMDAGGNIKSYLMGIALNIWKNQRRKMGRRDRIAPETDIDNCNEISTDRKDDPLEICMKKEKNRMLYQAVQNLPEKQPP